MLKVSCIKTDVPYQFPKFGEIQFHLTSSRDGRINIRHYFRNIAEAGRVAPYVNLSIGAQKDQKFNAYAVIKEILKVIILQRLLSTTLLKLI